MKQHFPFLITAFFLLAIACTPPGPPQLVREADSISTKVSDTAGVLNGFTLSITNSGGPYSTNYNFGAPWDSLGAGEKRSALLDAQQKIGCYPEPYAVTHESDTAVFNTLLRQLFAGSSISADNQTKLSDQLRSEYRQNRLFAPGMGQAERNYSFGEGAEKEYICIRITLCTSTALTKIGTGLVGTQDGNTTVTITENLYAGKLAFEGHLLHVQPAKEGAATPAGYKNTPHKSLGLDHCFFHEKTVCAESSKAAIAVLRVS